MSKVGNFFESLADIIEGSFECIERKKKVGAFIDSGEFRKAVTYAEMLVNSDYDGDNLDYQTLYGLAPHVLEMVRFLEEEEIDQRAIIGNQITILSREQWEIYEQFCVYTQSCSDKF